MQWVKKVILWFLSLVCVWLLGFYVFYATKPADSVINSMASFKQLTAEKEFVKNNSDAIMQQSSALWISEYLMQENLYENEKNIWVYEDVQREYKRIIKQFFDESFGANQSKYVNYALIFGIMFVIWIFACALLWFSVEHTWSFGIVVAIALSAFPLITFFLTTNQWTTDKVFQVEMTEKIEQCKKTSYVEKSNCLRTINYLNELKLKREFIKSKMEKKEVPFYYFQEESEIWENQFSNISTIPTIDTTLDFITTHTNEEETINKNNEEVNLEYEINKENQEALEQEEIKQGEGVFIPDGATGGGFYYIKNL